MSSHHHGARTACSTGSRIERAMLLVALGGLVAACARCVSRMHTQRLGRRSAAPARHHQTWEGEGGRTLDDAYDPPDSPSPAVPAP